MLKDFISRSTGRGGEAALTFIVRLDSSNPHLKILVFLLPITLSIIFLYIKLLSPHTYLSLIQEDTFIEHAQAVIYFISSILSFLVSIKFMKNKLALHGVLYGILAIGLLFISLEEISWGQRIFNIPTTDYFKRHNWQHEISFHNLDIIRMSLLHKVYILVGAYGTFAWPFVRPLVPTAKTKCDHIANFVVPDWYISPYFFFVLLIYMLLEFVKRHPGGFILWKDQEPAELLLSLGFLFFVITNYIKFRICLKTAATRTSTSATTTLDSKDRGGRYSHHDRAKRVTVTKYR